ncbi:mxaD protein [Arboricoccus pini]|uniref:MxaD protein n=1 Tax=Arboricoccus pini TaxID=1963835 RepID=A0A212R0H5_9PROT|nr:SRPBCC family protein [Arboricoccus pini]SNB65497.1 mxaD protein [Arboricoccus pini]
MNRRALFAGTAMVSLLPMLLARRAWAHGPTPHKADLSIDIKADPAKVWAVIANFGDISWNPNAENVESKGGNDPQAGADRTYTLKAGKAFKGGGQMEESLDDYDAKQMTYSWRLESEDVESFPVSFYSASIVVAPADGGSKVSVEGRFYRGDTGNEPAPGQDDEAAEAAMAEFLQSALDGIKIKAES